MISNARIFICCALAFTWAIGGCDKGGSSGKDSENDLSDQGDAAETCTEGSCEGLTPYCCDGLCRQCCETAHCDDTNECTLDSCEDGTCLNEPVADRTACAEGICCAGSCRAGGDCCSGTDCVGGCMGTERSCSEFSSQADCILQSGCLWDGAGPCTGNVDCTVQHSEVSCEECGCNWSSSYNECLPDNRSCREEWEEPVCMHCSCEWDAEGCDGTHAACSSYPNEDLCNAQLDCYWSACVDYVCT